MAIHDSEDDGVQTAATLNLEFLADLAAKAKSLAPLTIKTDGLGEGLPDGELPALWDNANSRIVSVKNIVEEWRLKPARKTGTAKVTTLESFVELVNRHKLKNSAVFADTSWKKPCFTAVIDYNRPTALDIDPCLQSGAEWGKHRVQYAFPLSDEWQAWMKQDGEPMAQAEFAAWIEDHIGELSTPTVEEALSLERKFGTRAATPSDLMQLSRGLQVNVEAVVKAAVTLQTGEGQIQWEESHKDANGQPLKIPGMFMLSIAPFFMGEKVRAPVRLRYRASRGGSVTWFYQVYRPDQFVTERVRSDLQSVGRSTALPTFEGIPEMPGAPA